MGKKSSLSEEERSEIIRKLAEGLSSLEISRQLGRDHRTIKAFVEDPGKRRRHPDKSAYRKIKRPEITRLKRALHRRPLGTSREIFDDAGIPNISKKLRCATLRGLANWRSATKVPPISAVNKQKRLDWAQKYLTMDFTKVLFTDECRASLDGPDYWSRGWLAIGASRPVRVKRQQGGGGVMFWAGIIDDRLFGPFRVCKGVKMTAASYITFLDSHLRPWIGSLPTDVRSNLVFMHDNAPAHAAKKTTSFLDTIGISDEHLMIWPPSSPDLNPIENIWSLVKEKLYRESKQYNSLDELWQAICTACEAIKPEQIKNITYSMNSRLAKVLMNNGKYISM